MHEEDIISFTIVDNEGYLIPVTVLPAGGKLFLSCLSKDFHHEFGCYTLSFPLGLLTGPIGKKYRNPFLHRLFSQLHQVLLKDLNARN